MFCMSNLDKGEENKILLEILELKKDILSEDKDLRKNALAIKARHLLGEKHTNIDQVREEYKGISYDVEDEKDSKIDTA